MCLKFDPEENTIKQTCSGKCKNKCGLEKHNEEKAVSISFLSTKDSNGIHSSKIKLKNAPLKKSYSI
ncbi:MAG: hypothetical protein BalsKO_03090 [Balneolaceae bacterium]